VTGAPDGPISTLLHDLQRFPDDSLDAAAVYALVREQAAFADRHGFAACTFPEHHGAANGYLPSPVVLAGVVAGSTQRIRLSLAAVILPLHDVLHIAEDVAVLDLASGGRVDLVLGAGYVPDEFAMFGASIDDRAATMEAGVALLRRAWSGEPFEHRGVQVRITPQPQQSPHPPILLGGSSPGAARRAARIADGFRPTSPELWATYRAERLALGMPDPGDAPVSGPFVLHVADDPERAAIEVGPAIVRGANQYLELAAISSGGPAFAVSGVEELEVFGLARIVDPDAAVALLRDLGPAATVVLQPRFGGMDADAGWSSLELYATKVLPQLGPSNEVSG
jgi:alkanesulfonate monooxygenase SsuD/methylene tetrahydromethanopterin reductase-like flavin-dependent oxidoreductase (luciferase family)